MSKPHYVVIVHRDHFYWPRIRVTVEARVSSAAAGEKHINQRVLAAYKKRIAGKMGPHSRMKVVDLRVVDELGLKRLYAAAKASLTVRRKRAAKKAAGTRAQSRRIEQLERENRELRSRVASTEPTRAHPGDEFGNLHE